MNPTFILTRASDLVVGDVIKFPEEYGPNLYCRINEIEITGKGRIHVFGHVDRLPQVVIAESEGYINLLTSKQSKAYEPEQKVKCVSNFQELLAARNAEIEQEEIEILKEQRAGAFTVGQLIEFLQKQNSSAYPVINDGNLDDVYITPETLRIEPA
jgi:hypothetical protein